LELIGFSQNPPEKYADNCWRRPYGKIIVRTAPLESHYSAEQLRQETKNCASVRRHKL